jgi:HSP20 family protein
MAEKRTTSEREGATATQTAAQQGAEGREGGQTRQGSVGGLANQGGQQSQMQGRQQTGMRQRTPSFFMNPFALLGRLTEEMTNVFDEAGRGRSNEGTTSGMEAWVPDVDVAQRGNELVVRVDLPGVRADDVIVEVGEDAITISGVREEEREDDRGGVYRYERRVGAFTRIIPLPEGAITDQARAVFNNGVLEIVVPAPPEQVSRGRRIDIQQGSDQSTEQGTGQSGTTNR